MKRTGKLLTITLAVALLLCIATVALAACDEKVDPNNPMGPDGHAHTANEYTRLADPTCTEPGSEGGDCTICGEYFTRIISPLGHDFDWTIEDADGEIGDDTLTGTIKFECKRTSCGESMEVSGTAIKIGGEAPTCDSDGFVTYKASGEYGGKTYSVTKQLPLAARHSDNVQSWREYVEEDCIEHIVCQECSREIDAVALPKTLQSEDIRPCTDSTFSSRTYQFYSERFDETFDHTFWWQDHKFTQWGFSIQPTCQSSGEKAPKCEVCGTLSHENRETVEASPEYHNFVYNYDLHEHWEQCSYCQQRGVEHSAHSYNADGDCACGRALFTFEASWDGAYTLKKFNGGATEVVVPAQYKGGTVTTIGNYAFGSQYSEWEEEYDADYVASLAAVTSVQLPSSVTSIGWGAFHGCTGITTVKYLGDLKGWCEIEFNGLYSCPFWDSDNAALYINNVEVTGSLIISADISAISDYAFYGLKSITSIAIPDSVTNIGTQTFYDCTNLTTATIPAIAIDAISKASLTTVTITSGQIPVDAFSGCAGLQTVTIGAGVTSIGRSAFWDCTGITKVNYLGDLKGWCEINFNDTPLNGLAKLYLNDIEVKGNVDIPAGTSGVGDGAFCGLTSITSVTIPDSVTSIGRDAFRGCTNLTTATIPANAISAIPKDSITTVTITSGEMDYAALFNYTSLQTVTIGEKVAGISDRAFDNCTNLQTVTIGAGVTSIGQRAFNGCKGITKVNVSSLKAWCEIDFEYGTYEYMANPLYVANIGESGKAKLYVNDIIVTEIKDLEGVESIPAYAFYGLKDITAVTIPDSVTSIGKNALSDCTNIATATMSASAIDDIPHDSLTTVTVTIGEIGREAFYGCTSLQTVTIGEKATGISDRAFDNCTNLQTVTIGEGVTSIGNSAFYGSRGITTVKYLGDLKGWCEIEFDDYGANPLYHGHAKLYMNDVEVKGNLIISADISAINNYAFYGLKSITSITIPDSVTSIGTGAFIGCENITTATMPALAIDYIPQTNLSTVTITSGEIGRQAFKDCKSLRTAAIMEGVTSIGEYAFHGCTGITSVTIPDSVTSIGEYAFERCTGITSITIPDSVTSIGEWAFADCTDITKVNYLGGLKGWCEIEFENYFANPLYDSDGAALYINDVKIKDELIITDDISEIGAYAFCGLMSITSVEFSTNVQSIGQYAFSDCAGLTEITIPANVQSIGQFAFSYCARLQSIVVDGGNVNYQSQDGILYKTEDKSIISIPYDIQGEVTILEGCPDIFGGAFSGCKSLTAITIPSSVTTIGRNAFRGCTGLQKATIMEGVTSIDSWAFDGCADLREITIPASMQHIDDYAFWGCTHLVHIRNLSYKTPSYPAFIGVEVLTTADAQFQNTIEKDENGIWTYTVGDKVYAFDYDGTDPHLDLSLNPSINAIYPSAFSNNKNITSVVIPDRVQSIGGSAFGGCTGLQTVTIGENVTSVGRDAFYGTAWYNSQPDGVVYLDNILYKYKGVAPSNTDINIQDGTVVIASYAFYELTSITSITIPASVTSIGEYAFHGCTGITSVTIPDSVTSIGEYAFERCTGITSITIPDSVTSIGEWAFCGCTGLQTVTIMEGVTSIAKYTFENCFDLTEITIPASVTSIGGAAFWDCTDITKVNYLGDLKGWCEIEFIDTPMKGSAKLYLNDIEVKGDVNIPEGTSKIGNAAFYGLTGITSITIPDSVTSIGWEAFYGCSSLQTVYYCGTSAQWNSITINNEQNGNGYLLNAQRYYFSEQPNYDGEHWHWNADQTAPELWENTTQSAAESIAIDQRSLVDVWTKQN